MTKLKNNPYLRVGTTFYKRVQQPLASGDYVTRLNIWTLATIKQDETPEFISEIPKYDSFCIIPDHLNFKQRIGNSYNSYEPFEHVPQKGECKNTLKFLEHIFGEQIEYGLDYIKLLIEKPTQILPILCLVSETRNTGKTTFLIYMKALFGANMTINTNEDFRSQFNSDWATKLIIGVDEVLLDKKEDSERIKNLSTSRNYKSEAKGIDKKEVDFFGKFILCSNNEDSFIKIDPEEIRYWIRKVPTLKEDNINLFSILKSEIPAFLNYLIERNFNTKCETRMWFTSSQIETEALLRVKQSNKTSIEKELATILLNEIEQYGLDSISFTNADLLNLLKESNIRATQYQIASLLKDKWHLEPNKTPSTYIKYSFSTYQEDFIKWEEKRKGRYYTFKKELFNSSQ